MKGKILGYSDSQGSGAIAGEDGSRHRFTRDDWRGERPPAAGATVDFESSEGAAREIYPLGGANFAALGNMNVDLAGLAGSPNGARAAAMFTRSLATPLALVVLAACFMDALASPMMSVNLIDLGKIVDGLSMAGATSSLAGAETASPGAAADLLFLRFAAPLAAIWVIWQSWAGKPERLALLIAGASAIGAAVLVIGLRSAALSMVPEFARSQMSDAISLGGGVWLLIVSGASMIGAGLGKLRNPLDGK